MVLAFFALIMIYINSGRAFEYKTDKPYSMEAYQLKQNEKLEQHFSEIEGQLKGFSIQFGTYKRINQAIINVELYKNNQLIQKWNLETENLIDNAYQDFLLDKSITALTQDKFSILIKEEFEGQNEVAVWTSLAGSQLSAEDSVPEEKKICYQLILENTYGKYITVIGLGVIILFLMIAVKKTDFGKKNFFEWIMLFIVILAAIETITVDIMQKVNTNVVIEPAETNGKMYEIAAGDTWKSDFSIKKTELTSIEFFIDNDAVLNIGIELLNTDTGEVYLDRFITDDEIISDRTTGKRAVKILSSATEYPTKFFPLGNYRISITNTDHENSLLINTVEDSWGQQFINTAQLKFTVAGYIIVWFVVLIIVIYLLLIWTAIERSDVNIERFFLISVIPLATIYLIMMLPGSAPDSQAHFLASYRLSNILLGHGGIEEWMGRADDAYFMKYVWISGNPNMQAVSTILSNIKLWAQDVHLVDLPDPQVRMEYYSIVNYLPQVLGLCIGRLFGFGTVVTIYLGRIFILITYIAACYHAIKTAPTAKFVFAAIPLLPMSLMMSSAYSYDAMVLISTLNFIAALLKLYDIPDSKRIRIECMIWIFVIGAVKGGGYLILLPLIFLLADRRWKRFFINAGSIVIAGGVSIILFDIVLPGGSHLFQFGDMGTGKMTAAFAFLHPLKYFDMCVNTYLTYVDPLFINMGGTHLAWMENTIPNIYIIGLMLIIGIFSIYEIDQLKFKRKDKWIFAFTIFIEIYFTPVMLLSWTPIGSIRIEGLQGRYYLPVLPIFIFIFTKFKLVNSTDISSSAKIKAIQTTCYKWITILSCVCVYYLLRTYLVR